MNTQPEWIRRTNEVRNAAKSILDGTWQFLNSTVVDLPTHYAVLQYRDTKGLVRTLTLTREGAVLTLV